MKITLNKGIEIQLDNILFYRRAMLIIDKELTHDNPNLKKYRNYKKVPFVEPYSYSFEEKMEDLKVTIPRGCGDTLRRILKDMRYTLKKEEIIDNTTKGYRIDFKHKFEPRDKMQEIAINSYINNKKKCLILQGSCGLI